MEERVAAQEPEEQEILHHLIPSKVWMVVQVLDHIMLVVAVVEPLRRVLMQ